MDISNYISQTVKKIPQSGIRKFFDMVNEMKDVISLSIGEPDFTTPWKIRQQGIKCLEDGLTHYSPNSGFIKLREEIVKYIKNKYNIKYNAQNQIIVTVGGSEALDCVLRTLVGPGDEVLIPEPGFVSYKPCVTLTGAIPVVINLTVENQFKLTPELLENAITNKTKALILSYPNNPTGAIMSRYDLEKIVEILKNKDIIVISDEVYSELTFEGRHVSIASFEQMKDKTLVINGFSKSFAMTGWRLGYVLGHEEFIKQIYKIHQYIVMCAPTISQYAAIEALKHNDDDVTNMVNEYNKRRKLIINGFKEIGLHCFEPLGAFYAFPDITSTKMSSVKFCERLLMEEKVAVVPGTAFGENGEGYIRACYACSIENIDEALKRIHRFIKRLNL